MRKIPRLVEISTRIATRFYAVVGFSCLITLLTIAIAWVSFERIDTSQKMIFERTLPESEIVVGIARTSGAIAAAVPRLTSAISVEELNAVSSIVADFRDDFRSQLSEVSDLDNPGYALLSAKGMQLLDSVRVIEASMKQLFALRERGDRFRQRLGKLELEIRSRLIPMIDNQYFYAITGRRELGQPPDPRETHFSDGEIHLYRYLSDIEKETNIAIQVLANTPITADVALLGVLNEQFNSARDRIQTNIRLLDDPSMAEELVPLLNELITLGFGELNELNGFAIRESELLLLEYQRGLVAEGRRLSDELVGDAESLVGDVNLQARKQAADASSVLRTEWLLLVSLGLFGIACSIAVVWFLVGKLLLKRLRYLSDRMRIMAEGDLNDEVVDSGKDEIAEMANALEVFRQSSLEAQRLNLVEKLANELQEKNVEMQAVVDQLRNAQNQIIMREKLAALGELTAGVAHEIKNPLNFVKNFSESSKELIEELAEVLVDEKMDQDERGDEIKSISEMLSGNCDRILEHGNRAVRIVNDMLRMGRDAGTVQETNINQLVDQHAKLAYHGARASTEDFQVKLNVELSPDVGSAVIVSQEIGRVVLNMVGNSCYATHQKRLALLRGAGDGARIDYSPEITVSTAMSGEFMQIRIRDNGNGIPESLVAKIFNPFFTTKPTDEGTGLGLAMSSDIVQKHGGAVSVETKEGEFTEMKIELPADSSLALAVEESEEAEAH